MHSKIISGPLISKETLTAQTCFKCSLLWSKVKFDKGQGHCKENDLRPCSKILISYSAFISLFTEWILIGKQEHLHTNKWILYS